VEFGGITGKSAIIRKAVTRAAKIAPRDVNVLLLGESGVGKDVFAHAIHKESLRRSKEIVEVNCAALPTNLLESELFGHVKGAFTDAKERRAGKFEVADQGTLFLDEVAECDLQMQAKLLRVLQPPREGRPTTRCFSPVGADDVKRVDVRIIAATNRDLRREIEAGRFREDLYYRLAGVTIHIPPLRERGGDVLLVADALLANINEDFSRAGVPGYVEKKLASAAKKFIRSYAWPGNIRRRWWTGRRSGMAIFARGWRTSTVRDATKGRSRRVSRSTIACDSSSETTSRGHSSRRGTTRLRRQSCWATRVTSGLTRVASVWGCSVSGAWRVRSRTGPARPRRG
jgi:transcriptional regulator with GAF, ATPase, and Fis domain